MIQIDSHTVRHLCRQIDNNSNNVTERQILTKIDSDTNRRTIRPNSDADSEVKIQTNTTDSHADRLENHRHIIGQTLH